MLRSRKPVKNAIRRIFLVKIFHMTCIEMKWQFLKIIALYFSCVMVKILKDFRVKANA